MPKKTPIVPSDLYQVRMPMQCRLSPGGDRLVVAVAQQSADTLKTHTHLWAWDPKAPDRGPLRQFTRGEHSESSPAWSPDGRTIAFLSSRSGKSEVWLLESDGGEARQLTTLSGAVSDLVWHPDGRRLVIAFRVEDSEAKEREAARRRGDAGAESVRVRHIDRLVYKLDGVGFLPQNRTHLWTVDVRTGRVRQLTKDDRFDEGNPQVTPDGRWVYFTSNRSPDPDLQPLRTGVWRIRVSGGEIERIPTFSGPSTDISLSPDGRWLAFLGSPDPDAAWNQHHTRLYLVPAGGGRPVELTAMLDRDCSNTTVGDVFGPIGTPAPRWSLDSQWIYFLVSSEGNLELWRVSPRGKRLEPLISDAGVVFDYDIDFATGKIFYTFADPTQPGELFERPLPKEGEGEGEGGGGGGRGRGGSSTAEGRVGVPRTRTPAEARLSLAVRRSELNTEWLAARRVATPEVVWFEGSGAHPVQGWVMAPPGVRRHRKYPGLLYIHGGPGAQYTNAFFHEFQVLAAEGYVVFYSNPRGGTGYSEKHLNCIIGRWGTDDYDDLMTFTDVVLRRHRFVDRRRLGVAGGSYGGFMTNWIIGHTQRFRCAVTQRSISNWLSFLGASDFGPAWTREFGNVEPWTDPMHYLKRSPLYYLKNMKTPTLIEHQEEDHRCPIDQGEQLWSALRKKGVPCEFLRYPAEPHGMSRTGRPDRRIDRIERTVQWLDRWLGA